MIRINLIAPERTKKAAAAPAASSGTLQLALLVALFGGGAALACAGLWWAQKAKLEQLDRQIATDERRQRELQIIQQQVDEFQRKKATLENKVLVIERLRLSQKSPVHMLDELSKSLPDYVWLTDYAETRGGISMKGQSNSLAAVADFMNGLQRSGWFPSIELASAQEAQNLVTFDLTGQFKDPEIAAKEAALAPKNGAPDGRPGAR